MIPKGITIVGLIILGIVILGWAMSHIVWILLGGVLGYLVREMVEHAVNSPTTNIRPRGRI
jgi:hypothetical protein